MHAFAYQTPKTLATLRRLERLAWLLDAAWRVPILNKRVGLDAVLDWIPGVGQVAAQGMAAYIVFEAFRHGAPPAMLARMAGRVGIDTLLSATPVIGWVGDMFYKANLANIAELRAHIERGGAPAAARAYATA